MSRTPKGRGAADEARDFYPVSNTDRLKDLCGPTHANLMALEQALSSHGVRADDASGGIWLFGEKAGVAVARDLLG